MLHGRYLRGHVLRCAAEAEVLRLVSGQSKVRKHRMAIHINDDVAQLEVSICDVEGVQIPQRESHFSRVKPGSGLRQHGPLLELNAKRSR